MNYKFSIVDNNYNGIKAISNINSYQMQAYYVLYINGKPTIEDCFKFLTLYTVVYYIVIVNY